MSGLNGSGSSDRDTFDPAAIEDLFFWDDVGSTHGWWPAPLTEKEITNRTSADLAQYIVDLRHAMLLPLSDGFLSGIREVLSVAEAEARRRMTFTRSSRRRFEEYDLLAAVEAACGPGRQQGSEYWFPCPFHTEHSPSFHVDPQARVWKCFGCGKGGGVKEWLSLTT